MIHVYKQGGIRKADGKEYTIRAINPQDKSTFIDDGWVLSLDEIEAEKPKAKKAKKVKKDDNKK